uniref:(northern house mosquito) hypothetical protein n=1 Tax=Culex pipiens TaxID=7175 RepID=A0A8D8N0S8_CULPI
MGNVQHTHTNTLEHTASNSSAASVRRRTAPSRPRTLQLLLPASTTSQNSNKKLQHKAANHCAMAPTAADSHRPNRDGHCSANRPLHTRAHKKSFHFGPGHFDPARRTNVPDRALQN